MKYYVYGVLAIGIFIVDRITKLCALAWCGESVCTINSLLSFEVYVNRGISWGMFHSTNDIIFTIISLIIAVITVGLCFYAYHNDARGRSIIGEICIIAGSFYNLIDRVLYGGVIDFIILSYANVSWPVFNIADVMIVIGVGFLIFQYEK